MRTLEVKLGDAFERPFGGGEQFVARVTLVLSAPEGTAPEDLRRAVERRVEALRSAVNQDVIYARAEPMFREGPATIEKLKIAIRDRVNRELQAAGLGADVVKDVALPDLVLPAPRP
jgi:hypothetical protein